jgi:hypothetical protein
MSFIMNEEYYELLEKFLERAKLIDELVLMSRGYFNQDLQALRSEQKEDVKKLRSLETEIKSQWDNIGLS